MHYHWAELDPEKSMKDARHLYYFKDLDLNPEKEDGNKKLGTYKNTHKKTHQRSVTIFCCCCGLTEEMGAARMGKVPHAQGSKEHTQGSPQEGRIGSSDSQLASFGTGWPNITCHRVLLSPCGVFLSVHDGSQMWSHCPCFSQHWLGQGSC